MTETFGHSNIFATLSPLVYDCKTKGRAKRQSRAPAQPTRRNFSLDIFN